MTPKEAAKVLKMHVSTVLYHYNRRGGPLKGRTIGEGRRATVLLDAKSVLAMARARERRGK